ncbi:MAG: rRNA pseudouridine synthase [Rubrivivax sp.]|nr:rRNA pseudouridine synthase [Rubrivivax sp.]
MASPPTPRTHGRNRLRGDPRTGPRAGRGGAPAARQAAPAGLVPAAAARAAEGVRISKLLTERGLASRREADEWIAAGYVRVGGVPAGLGQRAQPDAVIEIDERARHLQSQRVTVLLHKPIGYVSGQAEDGHEPAATLVVPGNRWRDDRSGIAFHRGHLRGLAPAGRLDIDSTGLLVLTQDGRIAKLLIGDGSRVEKEYLVRVRHLRPGPLPAAELERLRHGLALDGVALKPARVSWANEDQLRFVLREGRKRQIRRMCELVGLQVLALKRVRIGSVVLGALPPGQWRYLGPHERFA